MLRTLDRMILIIGLPCLLLLLSVVMSGVIFRSLGHPLSWTDEASGYLMVWCACFGWMATTRKKAHIHIRFFANLLPNGLHRAVQFFMEATLLVLGFVLTYKSLSLVYTNFDVEATSLPISTAVLYLPLIPTGLVMMLQACINGLALYQAPMEASKEHMPQ